MPRLRLFLSTFKVDINEEDIKKKNSQVKFRILKEVRDSSTSKSNENYVAYLIYEKKVDSTKTNNTHSAQNRIEDVPEELKLPTDRSEWNKLVWSKFSKFGRIQKLVLKSGKAVPRSNDDITLRLELSYKGAYPNGNVKAIESCFDPLSPKKPKLTAKKLIHSS